MTYLIKLGSKEVKYYWSVPVIERFRQHIPETKKLFIDDSIQRGTISNGEVSTILKSIREYDRNECSSSVKEALLELEGILNEAVHLDSEVTVSHQRINAFVNY